MERVSAGNEVAFRVGFSGHSGHLRLEPLPPVERHNPLTSLPDFILPPAFEPETPETVKRRLEEEYLSPKLDPNEFSVEKAGRQWDLDWFDRLKLHLEPSTPRLAVVPAWELPFRRGGNESDPNTWNPRSVQVEVAELLEDDEHGGSFSHVPGQKRDFVRGSTSNRPFRPGGLEESQSLEKFAPEGARSGEWLRELLDGAEPQIVPPSFKRGMHLGSLKEYPCKWKSQEGRGSGSSGAVEDHIVKFSVKFDDLFDQDWEEDTRGGEMLNPTVSGSTAESREDGSEIVVESTPLDDILSGEPAGSPQKPVATADDHVEQQREAWILPSDSEGIAKRFHELVPELALDFPFELDNFQKEAIYYLEKGESVFVAAHTSAGKTVVAEYAFALASKHCTRAVYTAPIKTISNQKYRDFCEKFDVGLLTGDVSLRPEASCLIMTTEILRSMLYRGADIIRDMEWVIFDEVHYVNDAERGVVWEEIIIMLPRHINFVLLSATVPNTIEFADWIGRTKKKKIVVTGTTKRPVPLEHCLFYSGELYKVCENEIFLPQGLKAAKDVFKKKSISSSSASTGGGGGGFGARGQGRGRKRSGSQPASLSGTVQHQNDWGTKRSSEASNWLVLVNKLAKMSFLPVIIFCFSKTVCDKSADSMYSMDLTTSSEKSEIRLFCDKAFSRLKGSDRNLPQIIRVQSLLRRGIGVHHAGLLPIVKEVVEMLFCRGVIKVLFSTETFAMGVNAPARTVVFAHLKKFDGKEHRQLLPGEYIQMAGRAGRRGLDKTGTVIVMCRDEIPDEHDLKHVIVGKPTRLESQFRLTYIMILHLLRIEELKVEDMLKRSFAEFHAQKNLPEKEKLLLLKLSQPAEDIECIKGEPAIEEYLDMAAEAEDHRASISEAVAKHAAHFLAPGRVVVVRPPTADDHFLGVILKHPSQTFKQFIVLVLTADSWISAETAPTESSSSKLPKKFGGEDLPQGYFIAPKGKRAAAEDDYLMPAGAARKGSGAVNIALPYRGVAAGTNFEVTALDGADFVSICDRRLKVDQVQLLEVGSRAAFSKAVQELLATRSPPGKSPFPPALDPYKDLKLNDMDLVSKYYRQNQLLRKMAENKCHGCIKLKEHIAQAKRMKRHREEVNVLRFQMSDEALQQMPEFQGRVDVLKEMGCIDADLVVQIKGRVACEMNSGEELICTECLFDNQMDDLEPEEAVALMSAFVFQQRNAPEPSLTPKLATARKRLYETAIRLGELQASFRVPVVPDDYARENLKFGLVQVVYEWAKGTPFADICELTDVPEGMIVRTIVRLDETCREFRNAAAIMGNSALHKKMEAASNAIKRDIVFAASLYVTGV